MQAVVAGKLPARARAQAMGYGRGYWYVKYENIYGYISDSNVQRNALTERYKKDGPTLPYAQESDRTKPLSPRSIIIEQGNAPLQITAFDAKYQSRSSVAGEEGIRYSVVFVNKSVNPVVAFRIGLVAFNVFDEFLNRTNGIGISVVEPGREGRGTWISDPYADFSFLTGVAYVSAVRLSDDTMWEADMDFVISELQKIQIDFDATKLTSEK